MGYTRRMKSHKQSKVKKNEPYITPKGKMLILHTHTHTRCTETEFNDSSFIPCVVFPSKFSRTIFQGNKLFLWVTF